MARKDRMRSLFTKPSCFRLRRGFRLGFGMGSSRFVLILGPYAIKFPKIRIFRATARLALWPFLFWWYKRPMRRALKNMLYRLGIEPNRSEAKYWKATRDPRVMPVKCLLFGCISVQSAGDPVSWDEVLAESPLASLPKDEMKGCDATRAVQFARHGDGRVLLVDYGYNGAVDILTRTLDGVRQQQAIATHTGDAERSPGIIAAGAAV